MITIENAAKVKALELQNRGKYSAGPCEFYSLNKHPSLMCENIIKALTQLKYKLYI